MGRPTPLLSFDYLRSAEDEIHLPASIAWFPHLQRTIEGAVGRRPEKATLSLHGGAVFYFVFLVYGITFVLADLWFYPTFSVVVHARLVFWFELLAFLLVAAVTGRWISHAMRVRTLTQRDAGLWDGYLPAGLVLQYIPTFPTWYAPPGSFRKA